MIMYEIELKAHVTDRTAVIAVLNSFATYNGSVEKQDTYWHLPRPAVKTPDTNISPENHTYISIRIRREISKQTNATGILLTYKRKELRTSDNGVSAEVNDEKECTLSDASPLEALLADSGFSIAHTKQKFVESWYTGTPYGKALFELCTVPPLGDFLEIEIMYKSNDETQITPVRAELQRLLLQCGIHLSAVEPRYYTDMITAAGKN